MLLTKEKIERLASAEVQRFIRDNELCDEKLLVLRDQSVHGVSAPLLAKQIRGRRKAKGKLPLWYQTLGVLFPPSANLEQSSSEETARFKSETMVQFFAGKTLACADLSGGFGVDAYLFSTVCSEVHYVEPNHDLLLVAHHNHELLGAKNIFHYHITAEIFMERSAEKFDFIYVDPSRRTNQKGKAFRLSDCEPNIGRLLDQIYARTNCLLIKASPLLDIQQGLMEIPYVHTVYVVSVDNECKELLFMCTSGYTGEAEVCAINLIDNAPQRFCFTRSEEQQSVPSYAEPGNYLYEPNASLLKAGAFKLAGLRFGLSKVHQHTHLYTSEELVQEFPGRIFRILERVKPGPKSIAATIPEGCANVFVRNYPLTAEALKKKAGLKDGGEKYLIGFSSHQRKNTVVAERLK